MFDVLARDAGDRGQAGRQAAAASTRARSASRTCTSPTSPARPILQGHQLRGAGRQDGRHRRPVRRRQVDHLAAAVPLLRRHRRPHPDRRAGHPRRDAGIAARRDRHGAAGHRAVQRHHPLQHPLRPLGRERRRGRARPRASRRSTTSSSRCPKGYETAGRRARAEALRRREAARRHRPHHPEGAADPGARRGDLGARQPHREGDPGRARAGLARAAPRWSSPTGSRPSINADEIIVLDAGRDRRARHASRAARPQDGLYASMWNRQREAEAAREKLALAGERDVAPNRNPPPVEDESR